MSDDQGLPISHAELLRKCWGEHARPDSKVFELEPKTNLKLVGIRKMNADADGCSRRVVPKSFSSTGRHLTDELVIKKTGRFPLHTGLQNWQDDDVGLSQEFPWVGTCSPKSP